MARIYERTTKRGIVKYCIDIVLDGKRFHRTLSENRAEAQALFQTIVNSQSIDCISPHSKIPRWSMAIMEFLNYAELFSVSYPHIKHLKSRLYAFRDYCRINDADTLQRVGTIHARQYLIQRKNQKICNKYKFSVEELSTTPAISTINREISLYKRFFRFCVENGWIEKNPWLPIRRFPDPVKRKPRYHFSENEIAHIFEISGEFHDYYYFLLHTGIRPTDAFSMRVGAIEGNKISFQMRKTGDWMSNIPLPAHLVSVLGERLSNRPLDELLFPELSSDRQRRYCRRRVQDLFDAEFVRKNFVNLHTFRHTYAHRCLDRGMPKEVLQTFLGHKSIRTTEIYANWVDSKKLEKWVML